MIMNELLNYLLKQFVQNQKSFSNKTPRLCVAADPLLHFFLKQYHTFVLLVIGESVKYLMQFTNN